MSDVLSEYKSKAYLWKVSTTELPATHVKKVAVSEDEIAIAIKIPYPLLKIWRENITGMVCNYQYIDFLNASTIGAWFKVRKGDRIEGRLERESGSVATKYRQTKGRKKEQLNHKYLTLCIYNNELVSFDELEEELDCTRNELLEWRNKYNDLEAEKQKLLTEMSIALERKDKEIQEHETKRDELMNYIESIENKSGLTCQYKKIGQVKAKQRSRKLKALKDRGECALWFAKSFGLDLTCIKFKDQTSDKNYTFNYDNPSAPSTSESIAEGLEEENESESISDSNVEKILFLLDKFFVSDEFYHELTIAYDDMPRSYLIKQLKSNLNAMCHIESVPGKHPGAQCSFKELLGQHIKDYIASNPQHDPTNDKIRVKVSMDGARMSRTTNFLIASFSLLESDAASSKGNRTIALINGPEDYETVKESLSKSLDEINELLDAKLIEIDGVEYKLDIFLGGDYKILLIIMGLSAASSDYACLWCKIFKHDRFDMSKDRDFYISSPNARTLKELIDTFTQPNTESNYCVCRPPLIKIELDHVILDELHLMLRVTDRMTDNLIREVMERDMKSDFNKKRGEEKGIYLKRLISKINQLGITFNVWEKKNADGRGSGRYDWTSLLGADKKKLLNGLPDQLHSNDILLPETKDTVIDIWRDFYSLYKYITDDNEDSSASATLVHDKAKEWIILFCSLGGVRQGYEKARVTPYMHTMPYHIPNFISDHGPLKVFTGQGVEKNNDDAKKVYFNKSNK
jgi:hypothetical protein